MTPTAHASRDEIVRLSPSLTVVVTAQGPKIPSMGEHKALDLYWADLELLLALAANTDETENAMLERLASETDRSVEQLAGTVYALRRRNRIREGEGAAIDRTLLDHRTEPIDPRPTDRAGQRAGDPSQTFVLFTPIHAVPSVEGFAFYDHEGRRRAVLSSRELIAATEYGWPITVATGQRNQQIVLGHRALTTNEFTSLTDELRAVELLVESDEEHHRLTTAQGRGQLIGIQEFRRLKRLVEICDTDAAQRAEARAASRSTGAPQKPFVIPYHKIRDTPPIALGMILANALQHDGGSLKQLYEFETNWVARKPTIRALLDEAPAVVLFSNYVWSHSDSLITSALVKRQSPDSVTVHGGPDVPSRPAEAEAYLRANPHVDIVVRGEGEFATIEILEALDGRLAGRRGRLDGLEDIQGLTYRHEGEFVRTDNRERLADLDVLPSPYLSGLFKSFGESTMTAVILESNRGCPYGCTFCDWGSATQSRIRKFSLERVFDELEWASKHKMPRHFIADANFGILPRDVEIARHMADLRAKYGYPLDFGTNYAKNTTRHVKEIVQTLAKAGVITDGLVSLQTTDAATLDIIERSNIRVEQYEELARTFREAGLPFFVDLMMGLPGSTTESFRTDLQHCVDREVPAKIYRTEMLVNSPMADPEYRAQHQIETEAKSGQNIRSPRPLLVSSASYTRRDFDEMNDLRTTYLVGENYAVLRYVSRFVRHETGLPEAEFYAGLDRYVRDRPDEYPLLAWGVEVLPALLLPPPSWTLYYDDVGRYLVNELGVAPSSALTTVLTVQRAVLPSRGRSFPEHHQLEHDLVAWMQDIMAAKDKGEDWCQTVAPLGDHPPGTLEITDPTDLCTGGVGFHIDSDLYAGWELTSPISRPHSARHALIG